MECATFFKTVYLFVDRTGAQRLCYCNASSLLGLFLQVVADTSASSKEFAFSCKQRVLLEGLMVRVL
jgi:hypothetical protein